MFPQFSFIFFLKLAFWVGDSPSREGPGYATANLNHSEEKKMFAIKPCHWIILSTIDIDIWYHFNPNTKEEGREDGEKKRTQPARGGQGSNPGPAAC